MTVTRVILPKLGLTMEEGRLVAWRKREGESVAQGEVLFEVETDKATMEVEAPASGVLRRVLIHAGDVVPVARTIALISTSAEESLPELAVEAQALRPTIGQGAPAPATPAPLAPEKEAAGPGGALPPGRSSVEKEAGRPGEALPPARSSVEAERVRASPAARKLAEELGVDLAGVAGMGPGGRITIEDVERAFAAAPGEKEAAGPGVALPPGRSSVEKEAAPSGERREPLSRMRRAIAERMTRSAREAPQFAISRDVDMTAADALRRREGVSYTDLIVAACARALRAHPRLRARIEGDALVTSEAVHVGIAVAVEDGLLVAVIRDADRKDLPTLARERNGLEDGARAGKLPADALAGGVFTVSNLGPQGVDRFTAIVNPPEAAILAVGRVADRVVARDGGPAVRPVASLTLSVDHRVADGATAARFLADVAERLERVDL